MFRRALPCVLFLALCCSPAVNSKDKPWIEVKSPHFRVLTDGSANDGRRVANEFEQMRAVFASQFPKMQLDTGASLLIFAVKDEAGLVELAPAVWKKRAEHLAGMFQSGWEKQFAIVRLDEDKPGSFQVVYHEYTHTLLDANIRWLPTWLSEGLADFYGATRFQSEKVYLGAPTSRMPHLRRASLIPLKKMLTMNPHREYSKDPEMMDLYYAESWGMVHFLMFGPGMDGGKKLNEFNEKLQQGEEQLKAFGETFGDLDKVQQEMSNYLHMVGFQAAIITPPATPDPKGFATRGVSEGESAAAIGSYRLLIRDWTEAEEIINAGLQADPKVAELHEDLGFLKFHRGADSEAELEFSKAYQLDNTRYLSLYYQTMMSAEAQMNSAKDCEKLMDEVMRVLKLNPKFAQGFVVLAMVEARQNDLKSALAIARRAEQLAPSRAGYHLLSGKILLRQGKGSEAAQYAKYVAERWHGPDHNEAVELWNEVPAAERGADAPTLELDAPTAGSQMDGTVMQADCGGKMRPAFVVVEGKGKMVNAEFHGEYMAGFSDTVWYGGDHVSACNHVRGMRALLWYRAGSNAVFDGEVAQVDYREDLPKPLEGMPAAAEPAPAGGSTPPAETKPN